MKLLRCLFNPLILVLSAMLSSATSAPAADPTQTSYSFDQCRGSALPYPDSRPFIQIPDSLTPVMINHVGRHGARYPANSHKIDDLLKALSAADSLSTITSLGKQLMKIASDIKAMSRGRWGSLDSLGISEQWGIASRMVRNYPSLFDGASINAISSYSPRCVMSMYSFLHQVTRLNNKVEISANSGRNYSPLMRFFDLDSDYLEFAKGDSWSGTYNLFCRSVIPHGPLARVLGENFPMNTIDFENITLSMYSVLVGTAAIVYPCDLSQFFTIDELNSVWSCFNLRQYLLHSCSTLSSVPMEIASPLLVDLIKTTDLAVDALKTGKKYTKVNLRFGHAETLMPLLALMHLNGCYYLTNYFDTVGLHWRDFEIVPMAANLQLILLKSAKGIYYVRAELNESPVSLIPGSDRIYIPWDEARNYLMKCVPIYFQN